MKMVMMKRMISFLFLSFIFDNQLVLPLLCNENLNNKTKTARVVSGKQKRKTVNRKYFIKSVLNIKSLAL